MKLYGEEREKLKGMRRDKYVRNREREREGSNQMREKFQELNI